MNVLFIFRIRLTCINTKNRLIIQKELLRSVIMNPPEQNKSKKTLGTDPDVSSKNHHHPSALKNRMVTLTRTRESHRWPRRTRKTSHQKQLLPLPWSPLKCRHHLS